MKKIKANIASIMGIIMLVLSVFNLIISKLDYIYRPKSYVLFLVVFVLLAVSITFLSIRYKSETKKVSKIFASFLPLIALIYIITLLFSFDFSIDYKTYSLLYYEILFAVTLISSLVIFFIYNHIKWLKIIVGIISAGIGALFGFVFFISLIFTNFGKSDILQIINSPDNTYVAISISHDEGALGGDTCVNVRDVQKDIRLLSGTLTSLRKEIWRGDWNEKPVLQWEDNSNLLVNGTSYNVKYILETKYTNNYKYHSKLKVYVPQRKPDIIEDTHGGFHGDGIRLEKFILTHEEVQLIKQDLDRNGIWKAVNDESKAILYGGAEGYWTNGLLSGDVPYIENGYFSVFNKQNYNLEFPKPGEYSYNYIIGIYSLDDNILYVFEMDT